MSKDCIFIVFIILLYCSVHPQDGGEYLVTDRPVSRCPNSRRRCEHQPTSRNPLSWDPRSRAEARDRSLARVPHYGNLPSRDHKVSRSNARERRRYRDGAHPASHSAIPPNRQTSTNRPHSKRNQFRTNDRRGSNVAAPSCSAPRRRVLGHDSGAMEGSPANAHSAAARNILQTRPDLEVTFHRINLLTCS